MKSAHYAVIIDLGIQKSLIAIAEKMLRKMTVLKTLAVKILYVTKKKEENYGSQLSFLGK